MEIKTGEIVSVFSILSSAKLTKMESSDKFKVIKAMRVMTPIDEEWKSFLKTVDEKLKKDDFEEMAEKARKWEQEKENSTLTDEEKAEINKYFNDFAIEKNKCIEDELNKAIELDYEKISENALEKLFDSNDFDVNQMLILDKFLK